ncbi:M14 family metallopeptidase, partial [Cellulomonas chitinilytica]|uniref:M14 family metallopeptidase n=1 Tax=Cellulomonas chitinilytica TaxID=398759 RepID=UPI0019419062
MSYLNVTEIESALVNLQAAYPQTSELVTLPHLSHEGRQTHVLRIGAQGSGDTDGVLLLGGVHAREWVPPDALVSLAADLLEAHQLGTGLVYGGQSFTADDVRQIVERVNLFVYPCVNPDGRSYSQTTSPMWRKNRRPPSGGAACVGVDINRNFDFLWDHTVHFAADSHVQTSSDPCDPQVYRGPSSASEPETQNVVWLADTYPRIRWHVDVHSAVPDILYSWGSDENQSAHPDQNFLNPAFDGVRGRPHDAAYGEYIEPDDLDRVRTLADRMHDAIRAVRGDSYGVEQAYSLYPTSGASDDYAASRSRARPDVAEIDAFTIECGHSFQPTWAEAENVIREVSAGLVALGVAAASTIGSDEPPVPSANSIALVRQMPGWASIPVAAADG